MAETPKTIVVYYSRTGNSRVLAEAIAGALDGPLHELTVNAYQTPVLWYYFAGRDALRGRSPKLTSDPVSLSDIRTLVLIGPVWAGNPAPPLISFLAQQMELPQKVGLFLTSGDRRLLSAPINKFRYHLGRDLDAAMTIGSRDLNTLTMQTKIAEFVDALAEGTAEGVATA
ncbi:MAG: hypothetical protein AAFV87_00680 [Pseudomonadota bacterium]